MLFQRLDQSKRILIITQAFNNRHTHRLQNGRRCDIMRCYKTALKNQLFKGFCFI